MSETSHVICLAFLWYAQHRHVLKSCVLEVLAILIEVLQFEYCSFSSVVNLLISASIKQANEECI